MTSEIFCAVVISGTAGAVLGYLLKHRQDTRHINELKAIYEDYIEKLKAESERFAGDLKKIIKRQDAIIAASQVPAKAQPRKINFREYVEFFDTLVKEQLPEDWQELDFPNSSEEEQ